MIEFKHKGNFSKTLKFLNAVLDRKYLNVLDKYGRRGVEALRQATPKDSGLTADSWDYEITQKGSDIRIHFVNSNIQNGVNVAILLQYGHATKSGGYVQGIDYVNPAIKPIMDKIADEAWKEVNDI